MSRKKSSRQRSARMSQGKPRRRITIAVALALSLVAGGAVLARLRGAARQLENKTAEVTPESLLPPNPSKEFIYLGAGGRLISTEESQGPSCSYSISPTSASFPASPGTGSVNVTAGTGCGWTATSNDGWISITSGSTGTGNGSVGYSVAANTGVGRNGSMTIAGQTFTVSQAAAGCSYSILPTSQSFTASAGTGSVSVTAGAGCTWTATSNATWITITSGSSGTGNGTVNYSVAANTGIARNGTMTIAGQTFTVSQAQGCSYSISPTSQSFTASAGIGSVTVTAGTGCTWTATSNDGWITITSGSSGTGNGTVGYSVAANSGAARNGTMTIAGQTFTVSQAAAGCSYSISPTSASFSSSGGTGSVSVTGDTGCSWTATSNATWITITSGSSGTGNGTVGYSVAANTGASRNGTMTIAGLTFTVTQSAAGGGGCNSASISPSSRFFNSSGGTSTFTVSNPSPSGCTWTAAPNVSWIAITSGGSGTGNGTVTYSVAPNTSGVTRTGKIFIGTTFHSVSQTP